VRQLVPFAVLKLFGQEDVVRQQSAMGYDLRYRRDLYSKEALSTPSRCFRKGARNRLFVEQQTFHAGRLGEHPIKVPLYALYDIHLVYRGRLIAITLATTDAQVYRTTPHREKEKTASKKSHRKKSTKEKCCGKIMAKMWRSVHALLLEVYDIEMSRLPLVM
jgi:hypothetical protein